MRNLTAVPDPGSNFAGWGGACSGTGTCQVTMSMARYVTASFTKLPATIDTRYYHTDPIGSVRAITDETGAVVIRHDYRPFGEDVQPVTGDPMRFAGKELDEETGQQYFDARYYRNTWGRFTTVDPITVSAAMTDPQQWNRYAYARNNPFKWVDPSGLCVDTTIDGKTYCVSESVVVHGESSGDSGFFGLFWNGTAWCEPGFNQGVFYGFFNCVDRGDGGGDSGGGGGSVDNGGGGGGPDPGYTPGGMVIPFSWLFPPTRPNPRVFVMPRPGQRPNAGQADGGEETTAGETPTTPVIVGTETEVVVLAKAITATKDRISDRPSCSGLFNGGAPTAINIMNSTRYQFFSFGPTAWTVDASTVYFNRTGPFLSSSGGVVASTDLRRLQAAPLREFVLTHETLHQAHRLNQLAAGVSFLPDSSQSDPNHPENQVANNDLIFSNCF